MKALYIGFFSALLAPASLQAIPAEEAQSICSIVDRYIRGSYHYLDCLNHIKAIDPTLSLEQTIDFVCSAVPGFYGLGASFVPRCYADAKAKLGPEPLQCAAAHNLLSPAVQLPSSYSAEAVATFKYLAQTWDQAYKEKLEAANNGLIVELQRGDSGCLNDAYTVSLDSAKALQKALKECVFTAINAYSEPAISPENQDALARSFAKAHWGAYRFKKLFHASLANEPMAAFNSPCVVALESENEDYTLYLAGYTVD